MYDGSILIVTGKREFSNEIKAFLAASGYGMTDIAESGGEALRKAHMRDPDIVIISQKLQDMNGIDLALDIAEATGINVILAVGRSELNYAHSVCEGMNILIIPRPINKTVLLQAIKLLLLAKSREKELESELNKLKKDLEDKKIVEKAKWVLVNKLEMTEPQAYRFIQKRSMDTRRSMREVALSILDEMEKE